MKDSLSQLEVIDLITIREVIDQIAYEKLRAFVELVSNGPRPDGTYNYCREALQQRATLLLKELKQSREEVMETILCHKNETMENMG